MRKKHFEKNIWPCERKWCVQRNRYYLRNQKRKIKMVRTRRKNARRKNCEKVFKNISEGKRPVGKPRQRRLDDAENYLQKMGFKRPEKNS